MFEAYAENQTSAAFRIGLKNSGIEVNNHGTMRDLESRITTEPGKCGGKPCIRGMRIRVIDVLDLLSNGLTTKEILEELPDLEEEDVRAAILYARRRVDRTVISV